MNRSYAVHYCQALTTESPFFGFDEVETVPMKPLARELREQDQLALERWLSRAGMAAEPALIKRTVIEFPIRRDG